MGMILTLLDELIENPANNKALIKQLNPEVIDDRTQVLDSIQELVERFVLPATDLLVHTGESSSQEFNLQQAAQSDFPDLILGVLERNFPALQPPPPDSILASNLDEYGFEIRDASHREAFFRAWMAQRALYVVRRLLNMVQNNLLEHPNINQQEVARLKEIEQKPLPDLEKKLVSTILAKRSSGISYP